MVTIRRVATHRHVIDGATRFRVDKVTKDLTVWWRDGTIGSYNEGLYEFVDDRKAARSKTTT
jgi:hypothetical protein